MIEDHGWRTEHEKKPNQNYGRDETVVWWVELVILHMVLLNDVQKIVVVQQIQYIAVCDATTNSPNLVCSVTVLSWCRVLQRVLKRFCSSQFCPFYCLFALKKSNTFCLKIGETQSRFLVPKVFRVCSLLLESLPWISMFC